MMKQEKERKRERCMEDGCKDVWRVGEGGRMTLEEGSRTAGRVWSHGPLVGLGNAIILAGVPPLEMGSNREVIITGIYKTWPSPAQIF